MFEMPDAFKENNEDYITIPVLKEFIRNKKEINTRLTVDRKTLMDHVIKYAESSINAAEEVSEWIDRVVKEGIKDVYVKTIDIKESKDAIYDWESIERVVAPLLSNVRKEHFCGNQYNDRLKLIKVEESVDNGNKYYSFYFGKMVFIYDGKNALKARLYPVFVDVYPEIGIIVGRAKPKQNMFIYNNGNFDENNAISLDSESEIMGAIDILTDLLKIKTKRTLFVKDDYKEKLYNLLERYTTTPPEIERLILDNKSRIDGIIDVIADEICDLNYTEDLQQDMYNLIEKYFSITYPNKEIFMAGRSAYPLRIAATDEEESRVDQRSAKEDPLQSKAVFFDNKKMIQKSKKCDSISFMFEKNWEENNFFKVRFIIKKDYCLMKFTEYTEEVDIQNVLLLFIGA